MLLDPQLQAPGRVDNPWNTLGVCETFVLSLEYGIEDQHVVINQCMHL